MGCGGATAAPSRDLMDPGLAHGSSGGGAGRESRAPSRAAAPTARFGPPRWLGAGGEGVAAVGSGRWPGPTHPHPPRCRPPAARPMRAHPVRLLAAVIPLLPTGSLAPDPPLACHRPPPRWPCQAAARRRGSVWWPVAPPHPPLCRPPAARPIRAQPIRLRAPAVPLLPAGSLPPPGARRPSHCRRTLRRCLRPAGRLFTPAGTLMPAGSLFP